MSKKIHIMLLFLTLGFFLMSNASYACGKTFSENKTTSKEEKVNQCKKDCCKESSKSKKNHGCDGKCGHSNCTTAGSHFSLLASNEFEFGEKTFNYSLEKPHLHSNNCNVSSGFTSIWLPPKIK